MSRVINTVLSLTDKMSAPLERVSKVVLQANERVKAAKDVVNKYSEQAVKNNEVLQKSKERVAAATKEHENNEKAIAKVKETIAKYSNATSTSENQTLKNNAALEKARTRLNELMRAQEENNAKLSAAKSRLTEHQKAVDTNNEKLRAAKDKVRQLSAAVAEKTKKIKEAQNRINEWGKSAVAAMDKAISRTIKAGAAIGAALGVAGAKIGFTEAFDMEGYRTQLETAVKDTELASELMVNAVKFANSTPFETGEVVEATAKMEAYGLSSTRWLSDIADMAGATNKSIDQATEAMADAVMGEWERLKEFGIKKEMLIAEAALKYGDNVVFNKKGQVTDQIKLEEILQDTLRKKFEGGAAKQAQTVRGLWSTITGVTKSSLAKIVGMQEDGTIRQGSLLIKLKEKMQSVIEVLNKWLEDGTMERIAEQVTDAISRMITFFHGMFEFIKNNRVLIETILVFVGGIYTVIKAFTALKAIMTVVNTVMMLLNGTLVISPLGWIAIAIGAVAVGAYLLWRNFEPIVEIFKNTWEWLKNLISGFSDFQIALTGPLAPVLLLIKHFDKLKETAGKAWGWVKKFFKGGEDEISTQTEEKVIEKKKQSSFPKIAPIENPVSQKSIGSAKSIQNNQDSKSTVVEKKSEINVTITGDVYGFDDFKEKVAEAVVKIWEQNKSNVVGV